MHLTQRYANKRCSGVGLGLRPAHFQHVLDTQPDVPWFEVHSCNYLSGRNRDSLFRVREHYPLSFHGVSLNLGGTDPVDAQYLAQLKEAIQFFEPDLVSDHACFTRLGDEYYHDLLPVPFSMAAAQHMANRISFTQDVIGRQIAIENLSRYAQYPNAEMSEGEFLREVSNLADCRLLLDINNAYVNQHNLNEDFEIFFNALPLERISELHLAGHSRQEIRTQTSTSLNNSAALQKDRQLIDTHNQPVSEPVWQLYETLLPRLHSVPTLIEWDSDLPDFLRLDVERKKALAILSCSVTQEPDHVL